MSIIGPIPRFQQNKIAKKKLHSTVTLDNSIIKHAEGWRLS